MSKEDVTHRGIVTAVERDSLTIRTDEPQKCEGCAITALCSSRKTTDTAAADEADVLTIVSPDAPRYAIGDRVEVSATSGSTLRATWWALALPTLIFGGTIVGLRLALPSLGGWSIAIGFATLAIYDLILYRLRDKISQKLSWKITKIC